MSELAAAEAEFEQAWECASHTRVALPDVDINRVLAERYVEPLRLTRTQLWDMEVRKAGAPGQFIPYVVREGSDAAWAPARPEGPLGDNFIRTSHQKLWIRPGEYARVLEEVWLNHDRQLVTFLGRAEVTGPKGEALRADVSQPLFHVQHGVAGTEDQPLNTWRIVLLTGQPDPRYLEPFAALARDPWLPGFVENYISRVLRVPLTRVEG